MTDYLAKRTALLPKIDLSEPQQAIGKSTEAAMLAGAVFGYRGLVKEILAQLRTEISGAPIVVATGGDAALIARGLPEIQALAPDLTLEGLRLIAARNLPA
jgi:type III pantothenate kinase